MMWCDLIWYDTVLYSAILHYTILYRAAFYYAMLPFTMLHSTVLCYYSLCTSYSSLPFVSHAHTRSHPTTPPSSFSTLYHSLSSLLFSSLLFSPPFLTSTLIPPHSSLHSSFPSSLNSSPSLFRYISCASWQHCARLKTLHTRHPRHCKEARTYYEWHCIKQ